MDSVDLKEYYRIRLQKVSCYITELISKSYEYIPANIQKFIFPYNKSPLGLRRLKNSFIYKAITTQGTFIVGGEKIKVTKSGFLLFEKITIQTLYKELKYEDN